MQKRLFVHYHLIVTFIIVHKDPSSYSLSIGFGIPGIEEYFVGPGQDDASFPTILSLSS